MTHRTHPFASRRAAACAAMALSALSWAAPASGAEPAPSGLMTLSASASVEVPQDWMTLVFSATREGADAAVVQSQLKQALDAALGEARRVAKPGAVEVSSGGFSIQPRYNQRGQLNGWQGSTELVVQGRDMAAIGQLSAKVATMSIARVGYSLSREAREKVEAEVIAQAIARFRSRAAEQTRLFGYSGFTVREVQVNTEESGRPQPMVRMAMAKPSMADEAALPVEAGKGSVSAHVSGSVQMK